MTKKILIVRCGEMKRQQHLDTLLGYLCAQTEFEVTFVSLCSESDVKTHLESRFFALRVISMRGQRDIWGRLFIGVKLRKTLLEQKPDIIYVIDSWTLPYFHIATLGRMRWHNTPIVYHTYDMLSINQHSNFYHNMEIKMARRADLNVNADVNRAWITRYWFRLSETPLVLPVLFSKHQSLFHLTKSEKRKVQRYDLGVKDHHYLVVAPTSCGKSRMSFELIQAFAFLPEEWHLVTIKGKGDYYNRCRKWVEERQLFHRIHFKDPMDQDGIFELTAAADVGIIFHQISSSLGNYFSHPSRLAYYLSLGLPALTTEATNMEAIIYKYRLGACCDCNSPAAIAAALEKMRLDGCLNDEFRSHIREVFSRELHFEVGGNILKQALLKL